jgi:hypothetical protein
MRGDDLRIYTYTAEVECARREVDANSFKAFFPKWEDISDHKFERWSKNDHDLFKEAIDWFAEKEIFWIYWT